MNDINFFEKFFDSKKLPIKNIFFYNSINKYELKILKKITTKKKFIILCDRNTYDILGKKIYENIKNKFLVSKIILKTKISNIRSAYYVSKFLNSSNILLVVGSGTVNEIGKYAAYLQKKEYIVFPTAPTNAYASNTASINVKNIKKSLKAKFPNSIVIDLNIIMRSPKRLINSAFFDVVCRASAQSDCLISNFVFEDKYDKDMYSKFFKLEKNLLLNYKKIFHNSNTLKNLFRACILMGLTTYIMGSSRFGSMSEHMISHYLDMFKKRSNTTTHGEQIALAVYSMIKLQSIFFKNNKNPFLYYKKNEEKIIEKFFGKKNPSYFINVYKRKKLSEKQIIKINKKLKLNWKELKIQFYNISLLNSLLLNILKQNKISYKKFGFSKKLYEEAILNSKYLRDRFTILDVADLAKILKKNLKEIII